MESCQLSLSFFEIVPPPPLAPPVTIILCGINWRVGRKFHVEAGKLFVTQHPQRATQGTFTDNWNTNKLGLTKTRSFASVFVWFHLAHLMWDPHSPPLSHNCLCEIASSSYRLRKLSRFAIYLSSFHLSTTVHSKRKRECDSCLERTRIRYSCIYRI